MSRVECLLPFLEGCAHRQRALEYLLPRYRWPVRLCYGSEPWIKADAINPAVERSRADILVIADADCWTNGLPEAIQAVEDGAPWAMPHWKVHRLTESATDALLSGARWDSLPTEQRPYSGTIGGGFVVSRRETLLDVPLDPRFVGWGQEDESWGIALRTLAGRPWRGLAPLVHLYHPPQQRLDRRWGSKEGQRLTRRYHAANSHPEAMRKLLDESDPTPQPNLPDRPSL